MIKQFKDKIKSLTNILNETKNLKLLRQQEINEIKNETKRKLDMLDYEINDIYIYQKRYDILETLDVSLTTLILKCKFFEKLYEYDSIKKDRKLRKINKIEA